MPSFDFSRLPREIRDKIYAETLYPDYTNEIPPHRNRCPPNLLVTNQQIHREALEVFYSTSTFHINTKCARLKSFFLEQTTNSIRRVEIEYFLPATASPEDEAYCRELMERLSQLTNPRKSLRISVVRRMSNYRRFCNDEMCEQLKGLEGFESVVIEIFARKAGPRKYLRDSERYDKEDWEYTGEILKGNLGEAKMWCRDVGVQRSLFLGFGKMDVDSSCPE